RPGGGASLPPRLLGHEVDHRLAVAGLGRLVVPPDRVFGATATDDAGGPQQRAAPDVEQEEESRQDADDDDGDLPSTALAWRRRTVGGRCGAVRRRRARWRRRPGLPPTDRWCLPVAGLPHAASAHLTRLARQARGDRLIELLWRAGYARLLGCPWLVWRFRVPHEDSGFQEG